MKLVESSVSPKGQVTIPLEVRRRWRLKARDRVAFVIEDEQVVIKPVRSPVDASYGAVKPLGTPMSVEEMTDIAAEEAAQAAAPSPMEA